MSGPVADLLLTDAAVLTMAPEGRRSLGPAWWRCSATGSCTWARMTQG